MFSSDVARPVAMLVDGEEGLNIYESNVCGIQVSRLRPSLSRSLSVCVRLRHSSLYYSCIKVLTKVLSPSLSLPLSLSLGV